MSMRGFLSLLKNLDEHTGTLEKESYISDFIRQSTPLDSAWAVFVLAGKRKRKWLPSSKLKLWTVFRLDSNPPFLVPATNSKR